MKKVASLDVSALRLIFLHETAKIGLIFVVWLILPGHQSDFCKHPTDRHHIAQNQMER